MCKPKKTSWPKFLGSRLSTTVVDSSGTDLGGVCSDETWQLLDVVVANKTNPEYKRERVSIAKIISTTDDGLQEHLKAAKTTLALELLQRVVALG